MTLSFDRQGKPTAAFAADQKPLPSPFSPLPGAESLAFLIADYRTESFFGQHSHERLETTLVYTRLYEPTVASHYYLAMAQIEGRMGQRTIDPRYGGHVALYRVQDLSQGSESTGPIVRPHLDAVVRLHTPHRQDIQVSITTSPVG